ncbi:hypothetical protein [Spirosoma sp.]|uniref:hypothetical protein n=1 Tax=Spirosoma sp. TaxID=1899569 RepID=UPI00260F0202|nr:hypothetical protein [Spirosoma sp.]MCX6217644.1 hypothetical protein [Spirosoma sp.]
MAVKSGKIKDLRLDSRNANTGTEEGGKLLRKSLSELGAGRSILVDKNNNIIAGNKTAGTAEDAGITDTIIVESDGTKLIVVKRTDLDIDSKEGRELALADNKVSEVNLNFDVEVIDQIAVDFGVHLNDWGFVPIEEEGEGAGGAGAGSSGENNYSRKIEPPIYNPSEKAPLLSELADQTKTVDLIDEINAEEIPDEIKAFLIAAAHRHRVFNYEKIADYYAHAPASIQHLMERSALVVIDMDQAIEYGFVKMSKSLSEQYAFDHPSDIDEDTADATPAN